MDKALKPISQTEKVVDTDDDESRRPSLLSSLEQAHVEEWSKSHLTPMPSRKQQSQTEHSQVMTPIMNATEGLSGVMDELVSEVRKGLNRNRIVAKCQGCTEVKVQMDMLKSEIQHQSVEYAKIIDVVTSERRQYETVLSEKDCVIDGLRKDLQGAQQQLRCTEMQALHQTQFNERLCGDLFMAQSLYLRSSQVALSSIGKSLVSQLREQTMKWEMFGLWSRSSDMPLLQIADMNGWSDSWLQVRTLRQSTVIATETELEDGTNMKESFQPAFSGLSRWRSLLRRVFPPVTIVSPKQTDHLQFEKPTLLQVLALKHDLQRRLREVGMELVVQQVDDQ